MDLIIDLVFVDVVHFFLSVWFRIRKLDLV